MVGLLFVSFLFVNIVSNGYTAFEQTFIKLDVTFDPELIAPVGETDPKVISKGDFGGLIKAALREKFPQVSNRREKKVLYGLVSSGGAFELRDQVLNDPTLIGTTRPVWLVADDDVDMLMKGHFDLSVPESDRRIVITSYSIHYTKLYEGVRKDSSGCHPAVIPGS